MLPSFGVKTMLDVPAARPGQLCHPGGTAKHELLVTLASEIQAEKMVAWIKDVDYTSKNCLMQMVNSTINYQYIESCMGVNIDFKEPFEADVLFPVDSLPLWTFGVRTLLV